jgi:hypothetical protein
MEVEEVRLIIKTSLPCCSRPWLYIRRAGRGMRGGVAGRAALINSGTLQISQRNLSRLD